MTSESVDSAKKFLKFVDDSPSPYHVVQNCKQMLLQAGFIHLKESETVDTQPMGKYFMTRNQSHIMAWAVGGQYKSGNGFTMFGAHTDSPCLRVKVVSKKVSEGNVQVGTECYGGGNWLSWFDRDLRVAGRLLIKEGENIVRKLVHINKPLLRVPFLAIHLARKMNEEFSINKETDLVPVLGQAVSNELNTLFEGNEVSACAHKHHPMLVKVLCEEAKITPDCLVDLDLFLADYTPSEIGGANGEYVFAPRLDNLMSTYTGLVALIKSCDTLESESNVRMYMSFDNEEVGSESAQGACSSHVEYILQRISNSLENPMAFQEATVKSMVLSADMAHGVHPNYAKKHESNMKPTLWDGPVIKTNSNNKYATTAVTATIVRQCALLADVQVQDVQVRNDSPCGTTIGPIVASRLGMQTCDIGAAQWSMHSIREVCGTVAVKQCEDLYESYFSNYSKINSKFIVD